ncbi:transposase [Brytella acorum]|uniref:transposase n=1 Tax=Brytella acorum TaxID=2959299 RepID=UPI00374382C7
MQPVFSDDAWLVWEPLIEAVRPKGKTSPRDMRRTISTIFGRHQNGAQWRSIPSELDPWRTAAQLFSRGAKAGMWQGPLRTGERPGPCFGHGVPRRHAHSGSLQARRSDQGRGN